ncbi:MAG: NAD(P)-dependent oxidoreductase [Acidimicrobiia bacterium]
MDTVGIVGVGAMGGALATNWVAAGFRVVGFDIRPERMAHLIDVGGNAAGSPADVTSAADRVILSLPSVAALDEVINGEKGMVAGARPGVICIETSTLPLTAKEAAQERLATAGMAMLDCPISGTGAQARLRDIVFYASGPEDLIERCRPMLEAVSRAAPRVGDFGAGIKMKLVSNLLVSVHTLAAAEAITLAARVGLEPAATYDLLCAGAGTSRMLEVRGPMMVAGEFSGETATIDTIGKDVELIMGFAARHSCPVPLLATASTFFLAAMAQGYGSDDPAVLAEVLRRMAGMQEAV